jgi:hypothetical protein
VMQIIFSILTRSTKKYTIACNSNECMFNVILAPVSCDVTICMPRMNLFGRFYDRSYLEISSFTCWLVCTVHARLCVFNPVDKYM